MTVHEGVRHSRALDLQNTLSPYRLYEGDTSIRNLALFRTKFLIYDDDKYEGKYYLHSFVIPIPIAQGISYIPYLLRTR